jgi:bifunctional non-homologous end joining protein LigD
MNEPKRVSLYFTGGGSDKIYYLQLEAEGEGWMVKAQNGKRHGTLTPREKTPKPVPYEKALKVYESTLQAKLKEGYTPDVSGAVFQNTPAGEGFTGFVPQLLNQITPEQADELIEDDAWVAQQKFDGERRMVLIAGGPAVGINRQGMSVALPQPLAESVEALGVDLLIDGEIVDNKLHAFDLLELAGEDLRGQCWEDRYLALDRLLSTLAPTARDSIALGYVATSSNEKRRLHDRIREADLEGVVFKRAAAPFTPGRPASGGDQLKLKFWESATLQVHSHSAGKRSVQVRGFDGEIPVELGSVTIPTNREVPPVGALVEVRYLYAYPGGGDLFQANYLGLRPDQILSSCAISQLKYKPTSQELPEDDEAGIQNPDRETCR